MLKRTWSRSPNVAFSRAMPFTLNESRHGTARSWELPMADVPSIRPPLLLPLIITGKSADVVRETLGQALRFDLFERSTPPRSAPKPARGLGPRRDGSGIQLGTTPIPTSPERFARLQRIYDEQGLERLPRGARMQALGERVLATPYSAGSLETGGEEQLRVSLRHFDCVTFVESMLALAGQGGQRVASYEDLAARIQEMRYRDGEIDGYPSRLHYFTDWIGENERRGRVSNITGTLPGAEQRTVPVNFMSTHREAYPALAEDDAMLAEIRRIEARLPRSFDFVPQENIADVMPHLRSGDVVGFVTSVDGLDFSHVGLVHRESNASRSVGVLHASTSGGVKISPNLANYVADNKSQVGIVVLRPLE